MQRVEIAADFGLPVERVYAFLSEHENLGPFFGARITRLKDGHDHRNGAGSERELRLGPLPPFVETVTEAIPNELIVYRITKGSPLTNHVGMMRFASTSAGSHLDYTIEFGSKVPGLGPIVARGLRQRICSALKTVDSVA